MRRLRRLPADAPAPDSCGRARALVADPDRRRRIALARPLGRAGYSVTFAASAEDVWAAASECSLIVTSSELHDSAHDQIARARHAGTDAAWIVTVPPRSLGALRRELAELDHVAATDAFAPPDSILFVANELAHADRENQRSSARLLYGTTVAFRGAGRDEDDHGHSYNLSEAGLYVRTLAPPEDDHVWLELRAPRHERRVRLVAEIAWRCAFSHGTRATAPPGFGVRIVDGARADLEAWRAGYAAFSEAVG